MRRIALDASEWRTEDDVYSAVLAALQAPGWHGRNLDALWDTVTEGAAQRLGPDPACLINGVQPPFHIVVSHAGGRPEPVRTLLSNIGRLFAEARAKRGIEVSIAFQDCASPCNSVQD
ncbi:barstar family protein [Phreatobacter stygius]|nr:barstar family protein [Phreatobacter stygius]